jgi:hypothetical protein
MFRKRLSTVQWLVRGCSDMNAEEIEWETVQWLVRGCSDMNAEEIEWETTLALFTTRRAKLAAIG